jgi:hypothetical protein
MSALLALSSLAVTAPAVSADSDHPMIIVQAVITLEDIAATSSNYKKAQLSVELFKDLRHWVTDHNFYPPIVVWAGGSCPGYFNDWFRETRTLATTGFRYYRGMATGWEEFPSADRAAARVRAMILFKRVEGRQKDDQEDLLDCLIDDLQGELPWWL